MGWKPARKSDTSNLNRFLQEHEHKCVSLTSRLLRQTGDAFYERRAGILLHKNDAGVVTGVYYVSPLGVILPVFTPLTEVRNEDKTVFTRFTRRFLSRIHSIIGTAGDVALVEEILGNTPVSKNRYILMSKDVDDFRPETKTFPPGISVRPATLRDAPRLFPLQKFYEMEEVLVHPERFNDRGCMAHLRKNLNRQIILVAETEDTIVAKAGTNGIGYTYFQLGGVYTLPDYRNQGISTALITVLMGEILDRGKKACLFVKKGNLPALRVYEKLGFLLREDFAVSYFF